jgi:hypothetical protein
MHCSELASRDQLTAEPSLKATDVDAALAFLEGSAWPSAPWLLFAAISHSANPLPSVC